MKTRTTSKNICFYEQTCITLFSTFLWHPLMWHFMEDMKHQQQIFLPLFLSLDKLLTNSRRHCLHLTKWTCPDRSSKGCKDAKSFFKGCFHYCRRHCCFSSLLTHLVCKHLFPQYLFYLYPCSSVNWCVCFYIYLLERV